MLLRRRRAGVRPHREPRELDHDATGPQRVRPAVRKCGGGLRLGSVGSRQRGACGLSLARGLELSSRVSSPVCFCVPVGCSSVPSPRRATAITVAVSPNSPNPDQRSALVNRPSLAVTSGSAIAACSVPVTSSRSAAGGSARSDASKAARESWSTARVAPRTAPGCGRHSSQHAPRVAFRRVLSEPASRPYS